jgi:hypothetical protein
MHTHTQNTTYTHSQQTYTYIHTTFRTLSNALKTSLGSMALPVTGSVASARNTIMQSLFVCLIRSFSAVSSASCASLCSAAASTAMASCLILSRSCAYVCMYMDICICVMSVCVSCACLCFSAASTAMASCLILSRSCAYAYLYVDICICVMCVCVYVCKLCKPLFFCGILLFDSLTFLCLCVYVYGYMCWVCV